MSKIKIINENGVLKGIDPETGEEVPIEFDDLESQSLSTAEARSERGFLKEDESTISSGTNLENLTFRPQNIWSSPLPDFDSADQHNYLSLHRSPFYRESFGTETNYWNFSVFAGSKASKTTGGQLTISNSTGAESGEFMSVRGVPPGPHFGVMLDVESWSASAGNGTTATNPQLGIVKDANNRFFAQLDVKNDTIAFRGFAGGTEQLGTGSDVNGIPAAPVRLLLLFGGNSMHLWTQQPGEPWVHQSNISWSSGTLDLYDPSVLDAWNAGFAHVTGDAESITFNEFEVVQTPQVGIRDPHVVIFRDGAPYIKDDWVYFTGTCALQDTSAYQGVFRLHTTTFEVEFTGALFSDSGRGGAYNDHAGMVIYDNAADKFIVVFPGWGHYDNGPDSRVRGYVGRTATNPLHGVHTIDTERMGLPVDPSQTPGNNTDIFPVYDEGAGAWRAIHGYDGVFKIGISETTDESLASGWSSVSAKRSNSNPFEGGIITKVNGNYVAAHSRDDATDNMQKAAYPGLGSEADLNLTTATGDTRPWPNIIPVPDAGETRYLLVSMDNAPAFGYAAGQSQGNLWVYEADERADGYEWPVRSAFR